MNKHIYGSKIREDGKKEKHSFAIPKDKIKIPSKYKVILHNDDYTTMEFVIFILQKVFCKQFDEANQIMQKVHNEGFAICGIYTYEIAESKVHQVQKLAKSESYPLLSTFEVE